MRRLLLVVFICAVSVPLRTQSIPLPPDIDPQSYSRLPLIPRAQLDGNGQRIYDAINGKDATVPRLGPPAASMHSVVVAEPYDGLN